MGDLHATPATRSRLFAMVSRLCAHPKDWGPLNFGSNRITTRKRPKEDSPCLIAQYDLNPASCV